MPDVLFILLLALVIFGPKKLPELALQIGRYLAQFKRMKRELTDQIEAEMSKIRIAEEVENTAGKPVAPSSNHNYQQVGLEPSEERTITLAQR
jgi:sec-independent protein translocase protein TatB